MQLKKIIHPKEKSSFLTKPVILSEGNEKVIRCNFSGHIC